MNMAGLEMTVKTAEYRTCIANKKKALFHRWEQRSEVVGESFMRGGHAAGQVSMILGIVEYEDGQVEEVYPYQIRFTDNMHSQFCFEEEGEKDD